MAGHLLPPRAPGGPCPFSGCANATEHTYYACPEHLRSVYGLEIRRSSLPGAGLGLFAARPFRKWETLCRFGGEVITMERLNQRMRNPTANTAPYAIRLPGRDGMVRDEFRYRSPAAFSNDSINPLLLYALVVIDGEKWGDAYQRACRRAPANALATGDTCLVASKKIPAGAEVTWHYGSSYWRGHNIIDEILPD